MAVNYRILSFDGGGIRGVLSASLLKELTEREGVSGFMDNLDMVAGTSTGGLIALMAAHGLTPDEIVDLYIELGPYIFHRPWWREIPILSFFMDMSWARYDNTALKTKLEKIFDPDRRLGDLGKKVLIPSFNLDGQVNGKRMWKPKFFHNFDIVGDNDKDVLVVDVALATSAAPTYFPIYKNYVDGGVVANNPSLSALLQAIYRPSIPERDQRAKVPNNLSEIALLSIGTGKFEKYEAVDNPDWGLYHWGKVIGDLVTSNLTGMSSWQCKRLLGQQYHKLNPFSEKPISLDDIKAIPDMLRLVTMETTQTQIDRAQAFVQEYFV